MNFDAYPYSFLSDFMIEKHGYHVIAG